MLNYRFVLVILITIQAAVLHVLATLAFTQVQVIGGPIINPANNHSYYLLDFSSWTDAEAKAISLDGHLVTINDEDENVWVTETFGNFGGMTYNLLWIGLNDAAEEGTFVWTSGEPVNYTNWHAGEPNGAYPGEDYAHIHKLYGNGEWVDRRNTDVYRLYGVVEVPFQNPGAGIDSINVGMLYSWLASDSLFWKNLNSTWSSFGSTEIQIDYTSLIYAPIDYDSLAHYNFDVIVIDNALSQPNNPIYSEEEIDAIERYLQEGHGLIVIGGTFRGNSGLAPLLGYSNQIGGQVFYQTGIKDSIEIIDPNSTVFNNISNYDHMLSNIYSGQDWANDGGRGHRSDWEQILVDANAALIGMIWNYVSGELIGSPISVFVNSNYKSVFCGHAPVNQIAAPDDYQFVYNMILFAAGSESSPSRTISTAASGGSPGNKVDVPIMVESQGDENALGFSLSFDPAILSNPQAALGSDASAAILNTNSSLLSSGCYGIALALPSGQTFADGAREIVIVSFDIAPNINVDSTIIAFKDQPITREVVDANANNLSATWQPGIVRIFRGFEADVVARFEGDGKVGIADWVQVGRFAAGLDTIATDGSEFQRADCAPRLTNATLSLGNGAMGIADWVQAGRYAAALDTLTPAGGPISSTGSITFSTPVDLPKLSKYPETIITQNSCFVKNGLAKGMLDTVTVELIAKGSENALGFSLNFNSNLLAFAEARNVSGVGSAALITNVVDTANGRLGIAFALPFGETFSTGSHNVVAVVFSVKSTSSDSLAIAFGDQPIAREVVDVNANVLAADWVSCQITTPVAEHFSTIPTTFSLQQNYPNPFNPSTTIEFSLPNSGHVVLKIFDLLGREVAILVDAPFTAGNYKVDWNASGVESGMYFYRIQVGNEFTQTKKLILMK